MAVYPRMARVPADVAESAAPADPFRPIPPLVIGLLGGVAAGKSTVAAAFARHGLLHVDADRIARQVAEDPAVRTRLTARFGDGILAADGQVDRAALARKVFGDVEARAGLEAILHPPIREAILLELQAGLAAGRSVLLDVPLLLENGLIERCHATVFVAASEASRAARAAARGWAEGELQRREAAQAPLARKRAAATFAIDNDGPPEALHSAVALVLQQLRSGS